MLRALRKTEGFTVTKISSGYEVKQLLPSRVVFKAMIGRNDYLVRHAEDLWEAPAGAEDLFTRHNIT